MIAHLIYRVAGLGTERPRAERPPAAPRQRDSPWQNLRQGAQNIRFSFNRGAFVRFFSSPWSDTWSETASQALLLAGTGILLYLIFE